MKAQMHNYNCWVTETNPKTLKEYFNEILNNSGFGVINFIEHHFNPIGYTAIWLLSESHLAIHTFPEENQTYIELSSCVKIQFDKFIKSL